MALADINSGWVPAWAVGPSANGELALARWRDVRAAYARFGGDLATVTVHQGHDTLYTSCDSLGALLIESGVRVFYSERGAMDNPWIESF